MSPVREGSLLLLVPGIRAGTQKSHSRAIVYEVDSAGCAKLMWEDGVRTLSSPSDMWGALDEGVWILEVF